MPLYEFECVKCRQQYEELSAYDKLGKYKGIKCPKCKSSKKIKLSSSCRAVFTNPIGTDLYRNSHDYRAMHEMEKPGGAKDQRKMAEELSHMGSKPYNDIDDVSGGKFFGEVK